MCRYQILLVFLITSFPAFKLSGQNSSPTILQTTDSLIKAGKSKLAVPILRLLLSKPIQDDEVRAALYLQYGSCQMEMDNADSSIHFLKQAAEILHSKGDKKQLFKAYTDIGSLLSTKTDYHEPIKFYKDALAYSSSGKDSLIVYIRMCALLLQNERSDSAYQIVQKTISKYSNDKGELVPYKIYYTELTRGTYFNSIGQNDKAVYYFKEATASPVPDKRYTLNAFALLADTYKEMKDYKAAFHYTDSANALLGADGWAENRLQVYELYGGLYEATGNYQKALEYARLGQHLTDSFYTATETAALTETAEKYKNDKIQAEKELADKNRDIIYRNWIFTIVALVLAASLALLFLRNARIRRKANELLTQQKQQVQTLADQLAIANDTKARLFSTIGHDLRSPVSSLYASLKMQELQGVSTDNSMSEHTVDLLDTLEDLLAWSKSQMDGFTLQPVKVSVPLLMEDLCKFYTTAATAKGITIRNEAKEKIILRTDENILKTILRNAISNAVAHTTPGGAVRLSAGTEANGSIHLAVSNPCSEASFRRFQSSYNEATIQGGVHGLGIVLIKEFAQKISATVGLTYTDGNAVLRLTF